MTSDEVIADYDAWTKHRADLTAQEEAGDDDLADARESSDDQALDLLPRAVAELRQANLKARDMIDVLADAIRFNLGPSMTCREVDAFVTFMRFVGYSEEETRGVLEGHAAGDDDEDDEHRALYVELNEGTNR